MTSGVRPVSEPAPPAPRGASVSFFRGETSLRSWVLSTDHKRIGILFFVATTFFLLVGGIFALLIRIEHLGPGRTIMSADAYDRCFTLHGIIMVWLFMIPAIPSAFGNFLVPLQIGAKDVAFPTLNLASFWLYVVGALVVVFTMAKGGVDTGWTFYTPYADRSVSQVLPTVLGIFIVGWSSILTGINFLVTIHTLRSDGLSWMKLPLFTWAIYGTSIIQVLATPVLGLTLLLAALDHALGWGMFDPAKGGDPLLFQHLFWFYSHPAVYIMVLPAMGVISEVVPACARRPPTSYRAIVYSTLGIAFVGFLTWGHHMFAAGIGGFDAGVFGILSMLVAVFSAIKVFAWVGTLRGGEARLTTPMLYVFSFLFLFVFGGMTGVAVATMGLDLHWHDTYFVVAHLHFIMVGGTLTAWLAAIHHWLPKVTGRLPSEALGRLGAAAVFGGFLVTFFPQFLLGNAGMPRRYYAYAPAYQTLHVVSTVGSWLLASGMLMALVTLVHAIGWGARAGDNPWDCRAFEWRSPSPPPKENFEGPVDLEVGAYEYEAAP